MNLGVIIFPTDQAIQPIELAKEVEARGFESLWFPEHSHIPTSRETPWGGMKNAPPLPEGETFAEGGTGPIGAFHTAEIPYVFGSLRNREIGRAHV